MCIQSDTTMPFIALVATSFHCYNHRQANVIQGLK